MADKIFAYKDATITMHLSAFGAFHSADVVCRNMNATGLTEDDFLAMLYEGIDTRARNLDAAPAPASPADSGSPSGS